MLACLERKPGILRADRSVYVVDDDPSFRRSMRRLLREYGYDATLFESAGALLEHGKFDRALCIVLDIDLAGHSGIDLRRQLAAMGIVTPIIFVTGNESEVCRSTAMTSGCAAYLNKPFESGLFIVSVDAVCGRTH
ncbi:response regulator transcription factor [Bradyrhizobium sp. PUT101]|uniref:response regulator transcription factor n=1 Tax=Bradyrhizobium sp. PUT101 TaxID=3447427 RepID=UPI003F829CF0